MAKQKKKESPAPEIKKEQTQPVTITALWYLMLLFFVIVLILQFKKPETDPKVKTEESVKLTFSNWINHSYQRDREERLKKSSTLGKESIPLKNQIDFDWFHKVNVNEFVLGKDDYIFNIPYINAYLGRDFVGEETIKEQLRKTQVVADTLKRKGIDLVVVFAPGKGTYYAEYLPSKYLKYPRSTTNYEVYTQKIKEYNIHYVDFQSWFLQMKPDTKYPLFPQYGHHWSYYGEVLAADSLITYFEQMRNIHLPHLRWKEIDYPAAPKVRDADILGKAKLKTAPEGMMMAYPKFGYAAMPDATKVKTLAVADSYYRGFLYLGVMQNVFDNGKYWYYNNKVIPESDTKLLEVWEVDLKKEIEKNQVVLIMNADATLSEFSSGFIDQAYLLYTDPKQYYAKVAAGKDLLKTKKMIRETPSLLSESVENAQRMTISVDSAITLKAMDILNGK